MQYFAFVVLLAVARTSLAGRAFPVEAENFVIDEFRKINPGIEWDPTNFLIDLSGRYSLCDNVNVKGSMYVDRATADGSSIGALVDSHYGSATDSVSVTGYLKEALPTWAYRSPYRGQIERAQQFGCSVQPGCNGQIAIACLFAPEYNGGGGQGGGNIIGNPTEAPKAQAFTPEQYLVAEEILGMHWDRSHLIENLSGYETDCAMVEAEEWPFALATEQAKNHGMSIYGLYGSAPNYDDTEQAMVAVLESWNKAYNVRKFRKQVGCSLIPDCWATGRGDQDIMHVVVSCLFEE